MTKFIGLIGLVMFVLPVALGEEFTAAMAIGVRVGPKASAIANELVDDSGTANDEGDIFRVDAGNEFYIYNLSTKPWDATSGARFKVTVRISKTGRADSFCEFHLVNK